MLSSVFCVRVTFVVLMAAAISGCGKFASQSSSATLDCDDRYTRCAVLSEQQNKVEKTVQNEEVPSVASPLIILPPTVAPILFDFDRATASRLVLDEAAAFLIMYPESHLTLHGYTDPIGQEAYNQALSYQRAAYVRERLLMLGVSAAQISVQAHGESGLLVKEIPNTQVVSKDDLVKQYAANRRVEFEFSLPNTTTLSN
ncbi:MULTISPECIES: OmpA family protein [Marinomonas]|uniref:OmpA family protein n=1 Tax=Marinomonas rhodophyticola TaxID=2992803 RepID=A0ABT3KHH7_9GAMM|nr:OmpA family protein [Marinomonas sp. KJ51-3]MCW4629899.1 OmpA family protein [Marinomonas sp. KJ51-3]